MANLINTPEEYLSQINYDLQTNLGIKDTKLLTSGALSVLANMLSNIAFDAQKYYEYVTKEFNVATAQNFKSMLFHASVYSYDFNLALPSKVTSYLMIPKVTVNSNRKLKYTVPSFSYFEINNAAFRIEGEINVEITENAITATLTDGIGTYQLDIIDSVDDNNTPTYFIIIPDDKVRQVERIVDKFVVPAYDIGDNVSYNIPIPEGHQLYLMKTYVNTNSNPPIDTTGIEHLPIDAITNIYPQLEEFDLKYFKFNTTSTEKVIFANLTDYQNITFTLGNGLYGYKLSTNDEVITIVEFSLGAAGNVPSGLAQIENINYYEIDTNTNDTIVFNTVNLNVKTETPASGGQDASSIDDIRFGILKKITERNSLITQLDFEKYFANPVTKKFATVISRQIDTSSPIVSVYNILRNPYTYEIVESTTLNIDTSSCFSANNWCINPEYVYNGVQLISPLTYIDYNGKVTSYYKYDNLRIPLTILRINSNPEINIELYIKWDATNEAFYFESNAFGAGYTLIIESNVGNYELSSANSYRADISSSELIYNKFFDKDLIINSVNLRNDSTNYNIHEYNVVNSVVVMKKIQNHKKYTFQDGTEKLLFLPFIKKEYHDNFANDIKYESSFVDYFIISEKDLKNKIAFNISINQALMNTIDVDNIVADGVQINDNNDLLARYPVSIEIKYDSNALSSSGLTLIDLKTDISLAVLGYLNDNEGDGIEIYTTSIIKLIKEMYPDIINEVTVESPKTLVVEKWDSIIENGNYNVDDQLTSVPTYFHFDVNNMDIKFIIS